MPNNPRQAIKQKLTGAFNELIKAGTKLTEVSDLYSNGGHPEIAETMQPWIMAIQQECILLDAFIKSV